MTPIDLYTWGTPNGHKVSIMLEEVGLPYTVHAVNISRNESWTPEYLAMNPNGKIPVIVDPDAGRTVVESGAILLYLAERSGKLRPGPADETMTWLFFQAAHVGPMLGQLGFFKVFSKDKIPAAIERFEKESARVLGVLNTRLEHSEHLGGAEYGLADIMTFPWVRAARIRLGIDLAGLPHLARWADAIDARPAVQRGLAVPPPAA
jgi:GST-like protein